MIGSNTYQEYGPDLFMDQEIIVVAINYRLSSFGFLSTTTEEIPGNLELIQRFINSFIDKT